VQQELLALQGLGREEIPARLDQLAQLVRKVSLDPLVLQVQLVPQGQLVHRGVLVHKVWLVLPD
jgi:hypothetical protein